MYIYSKFIKDKITVDTVLKLYKNCDNELVCVNWNYRELDFYNLISRAKRLGAKWTGRYWEFETKEKLESFLNFKDVEESYKTVVVEEMLKDLTVTIYKTAEANVGFFYTDNSDLAMLFLNDLWLKEKRLKKNNIFKDSFALINDIDAVSKKIEEFGGLVVVENYVPKAIAIVVEKHFVKLMCDLNEPLHYLIREKFGKTYRWKKHSYNQKVPISWDGTLLIRKNEVDNWKEIFEESEIPYVEESEKKQQVIDVHMDTKNVPGWNKRKDGKTLTNYQKDGIKFVSNLGGRAIIGDEMGTGKTAQAISFALSQNIKKIVVVAPLNAKYVWEREILEWSDDKQEDICHFKTDFECNIHAKWIVVNYEKLVSRLSYILVENKSDYKLIKKVLKKHKKSSDYIDEIEEGEWKIKIDCAMKLSGLSADVQNKWDKIYDKFIDNTVKKILDINPELIIFDEAHRLKNTRSKRTKSAEILSKNIKNLLMLTGTPIRNKLEEFRTLVNMVDGGFLEKSKKYLISIDGVVSKEEYKGYLTDLADHYMIRRTKKDVISELPPKIRNWYPLELDETVEDVKNAIDFYNDYMDYFKTLNRNYNPLSILAKARQKLGLAKVSDPKVADIIKNIVEERGCCLVFTIHHAVSDRLYRMLRKLYIKVAIVDGRTKPEDRKKIEEDFQNGKLDVFIGGMNAAGESITLTRADTCVFIESDYVPAAMMQAEDRGHRIGQRSNGYYIIHLYAIELELDKIMKEILERKISLIDDFLSENSEFDFRGTNRTEKNNTISEILRRIKE